MLCAIIHNSMSIGAAQFVQLPPVPTVWCWIQDATCLFHFDIFIWLATMTGAWPFWFQDFGNATELMLPAVVNNISHGWIWDSVMCRAGLPQSRVWHRVGIIVILRLCLCHLSELPAGMEVVGTSLCRCLGRSRLLSGVVMSSAALFLVFGYPCWCCAATVHNRYT